MLEDFIWLTKCLMNMSLALAYRGNINKIFIWVGTLSNNEDKAYEVSRKYLKEQGETFV